MLGFVFCFCCPTQTRRETDMATQATHPMLATNRTTCNQRDLPAELSAEGRVMGYGRVLISVLQVHVYVHPSICNTLRVPRTIVYSTGIGIEILQYRYTCTTCTRGPVHLHVHGSRVHVSRVLMTHTGTRVPAEDKPEARLIHA